jgi:hypothetical protein
MLDNQGSDVNGGGCECQNPRVIHGEGQWPDRSEAQFDRRLCVEAAIGESE